MRDKLNQILLATLPPDTVEGNRKLVAVEQRTGAQQPAVCRFSDGTCEEFDVVIGCDGINSVVRRHVAGMESPSVYSGIRSGSDDAFLILIRVWFLFELCFWKTRCA